MASSQTSTSDHDHGGPVGHVIGHNVDEPLPPPRDPSRPFGRIGPYADLRLNTARRPVGHCIGQVSPMRRGRPPRERAKHVVTQS